MSDDDFEDSELDENALDFTDLGSCCCCGRAQDGSVRTLVMLDFRAPSGFLGWGCVVCGLDSRGATAVVCDACVDRYEDEDLRERLKWIQGGQYATDKIRVPLEGFPREPHGHELAKHPEIRHAES